MVNDRKKCLYSYDVFDTLITRTTATPLGIFALMEALLDEKYVEIARILQHDFYRIRIESQRQAVAFYCKDGKEDVSLSEIYEVMRTMAPLTDEDVRILMNLELETEKRNSIGIRDNINAIIRYKENGDRVVLISDMYLGSDAIRELLLVHNEVFRDIPIYVSSELGMVKGNPDLWRAIRKKELILWENWTHIGDNRQGDIAIPKSLGIKTKRYCFERLTTCEKQLVKLHETDPALQLFIGASRNSRMLLGGQPSVQFGSSYGAAVLLSYVLWVLNICLEKGIRDLYFVARDGWILLQIANTVNRYRKQRINMKYIYGSRKAWRSKEFLQDDVWDRDYYHLNSKELDLLKAYFRQEINLGAKEIGFVEVHGNGDTQDCVGRILSTISDVKISSFYIALDRQICSEVCFYRYFENYPEFSGITEIMTRALHGKTVGYEDDNGIVPIIEDDDNTFLEKYGYGDYLHAVELAVECFADYLSRNSRELYGFRYGLDYFSYLINKENGKIFEYICDIPNSNMVDGNEERIVFAPAISQSMIDEVRTKGYFEYDGWCLPFSIRRLTGKQRKQIEINRRSFLNEEKKKEEERIKKWKQDKKERDKIRKPVTYLIDKDKLKKRIVLYGAGKVGKSLFEYITTNELSHIVAWIDRETIKKNGIIDRLDNIGSYEYDMILIAIKHPDLEEIKIDLMSLGCDPQKIYWEDYQSVPLD